MPKKSFHIVGFFAALALFFASPILPAFATGAAGDDGSLQNGKPQIGLLSYEVAEGALASGSNVTLRLAFTNNSSDDLARDILVTFGGGNGSIYPVFGASDQIYIGTLEPGATATVEKEFSISTQAPDMMALPMSIEYIGLDGWQMTNQVAIYLPVWQITGFSAQYTVPHLAFAGQPTYISSIVSNSSGQNLTDMVMVLEGDIEGGLLEVDLGNLQIEQQLSFEQTVTFNDTGDNQRLAISFRLFDEVGNLIELEPVEYAIKVEAPKSNSDASPEVEASGSVIDRLFALLASSPLVLGASGAALVVLLVLLVIQAVWRRKK